MQVFNKFLLQKMIDKYYVQFLYKETFVYLNNCLLLAKCS